MDNPKVINGHRRHHDPMQILDVANHMKTLIHIGYVSGAPTTENSNGSQLIDHMEPKAIMNEEAIWRRWHSKIHASNNEMNISPKTRSNGLSYGQTGWPNNQQLKQLQPNLKMMNYSNGCNTGMIPQPVYNGEKNSYNKFTALTKDRESFRNYCKHCTIHGFKYVGETSLPLFERIFWVVSVMLALCGAAFFIWHLYSKFSTSPIIISRSSQSVYIDEIPFPSLTICNMNMAKKSLANQVLQSNDDLQKFFLDDICNRVGETTFVSSEVKNEASEWSHRINFLQKASPSCTDMLYYCKWNSNVTNCTDLFNPVYTDEGICCNFNSVKQIQWKARKWGGLDITWASDDHVDWNPEYVFKKTDPFTAIPWRGRSSGVSHGLTLALDVNLDEYYCSATASVGFKMLLHSPVEMPQISDYGFALSPGKETRVIITPQITDADSTIMNIAPKIRQCYFLNERRLRYYRTYTERNCQLECEANFTLQMCDCMQYYMPVETDTKICGKFDDECTARAKRVVNEKLDDEGDGNSTTIPSCKCYPGCHEIYYSTEISHSMLIATFQVDNEYMKHNANYFEKNVAIVHVFYVDTSHVKYTKNELYGFVELLSNTGGLLGLFMGFSLMSVMEIMYYVLLWLRRSLCRKNRQTNYPTVQAATRRRDAVYPFTQ